MARSKPRLRWLLLGLPLIPALTVLGQYSYYSPSPPPLQSALEQLAADNPVQAEQLAAELVASAPSVPRAQLVLAAARQRQGKLRQAAEDFQKALADCRDEPERRYAQAQIARCQAGAQHLPPPPPPSAWLTDEDKRDLAKVADEVFTESSEHFVVHARNSRLSKLVAQQAEDALRRICQVILPGQVYPHSVTIHVWPDQRQFQLNATNSPEWAGGSFSLSVRDGVASRRIDLTQRTEANELAVMMLDRVLPHEMCHLVVQESFGDSPCPLFLNEGLAMMSEYRPSPERLILAGAALAGDAGIPLSDLFATGRHSLTDPAVFYAESYSLLSYLHGRLTTKQFRGFLDNVKNGCTASDALQRALLVPHDGQFVLKLAAAWQDYAILDAKFLRALQEDSAMLTTRRP